MSCWPAFISDNNSANKTLFINPFKNGVIPLIIVYPLFIELSGIKVCQNIKKDIFIVTIEVSNSVYRRQINNGDAPNRDNEQPPDDFREIQIFPQTADMQVSKRVLAV